MTHEDFHNYAVHVRPALQGTYRGRKVYTQHAPTSGPVLLHMLNLMEHYENLTAEGRSSLNTHRLVEAMKCGSGQLSDIFSSCTDATQLVLPLGQSSILLRDTPSEAVLKERKFAMLHSLMTPNS